MPIPQISGGTRLSDLPAHINSIADAVNAGGVGGSVMELEEIRYAHPDGNDANDGLTWGTAKQTILGAYDAGPAAGVEIHFADQTPVGGEVANQGLWLAGAGDSGYSNLPAGWRQAKPLSLIGNASVNGGGMFKPAAHLVTGSATDLNKPGLWFSGGGPIYIENAIVGNHATALLVGKDSVTGEGTNSAGYRFNNCMFRTNQGAGLGPAVHLFAAYWIYFYQCVMAGNEQEDWDSDQRADVLNPGNPIGNGLHWFQDCRFFGGAGYYMKSQGTPSMDVLIDGITQESTTTPGAVGGPVFWLDGVLGPGAGHAIIRYCESSDRVAGSQVAVMVDRGNPPERVIVQSVPDWEGPVLNLGDYGTARTRSLLGDGAVGFHHDYIHGRHEGSHRAISPAAVRYPNLADHDPANWTELFGAVITTDKTAPDGTTGAVEVAAPTSSTVEATPFSAPQLSRAIAVGDWLIGGVWVRSVGGEGINTAHLNIAANGSGNGVALWDETPGGATVSEDSPFPADDAWHWVTVAGKITAAATSPADVTMRLRAGNNAAAEYYAPVFLHVPAADALSESEVREMTAYLHAYSDVAPVGSVSTLRGQKLIARAGLGVGNSAAGSSLGSVTKKIEIFDETGASLGFIPVYDAIT